MRNYSRLFIAHIYASLLILGMLSSVRAVEVQRPAVTINVPRPTTNVPRPAINVPKPNVTVIVPRPSVNVARPSVGVSHPTIAAPKTEATKSTGAVAVSKTDILKSTERSDPIVKNGDPAAKVQSSTTLRDSADGVGSAPLTNAGPSATAPGVLPAKSTSSDVIVNPSSIAAPANAGSGVVVNAKSIPAGTALPPTTPGQSTYVSNQVGGTAFTSVPSPSTAGTNGSIKLTYFPQNGIMYERADGPNGYTKTVAVGTYQPSGAPSTGSGFSYGTVGGVNYGVTTLADPAQAPVHGSQQGQGLITSGGYVDNGGPATPSSTRNGGGETKGMGIIGKIGILLDKADSAPLAGGGSFNEGGPGAALGEQMMYGSPKATPQPTPQPTPQSAPQPVPLRQP